MERKIPESMKRKLNNIKITRYMANKFFDYLVSTKKIKRNNIKMVFSVRKVRAYPAKRILKWGESIEYSNEIVLYRHSVWILLHELAHVVAPWNAKHDRRFAKKLQLLNRWWGEFKGENT
jgi:hypothetical protein